MSSEPGLPVVVPRPVLDAHARLHSLFPGLDADRIVVVDDGWDNVVLDVDDRWMVRIPRSGEVAEWLRAEVALLHELRSALPLPIPVVERVAARIDDPASELAWFLAATPPSFSGALVDAYGGVDDAFRERARRRGALIAWHEVAHGAEHGLPEFVASGLQAVREGLRGA